MEQNQEEIIDLDLYTLLPLLRERKETCILQTDLRHGFAELGLKGTCTITVRLDLGQVTHCGVANHQWKALEVDLTRFALYRARLSWRFALLAPESQVSAQTVSEVAPVPAQQPVASPLPLHLPMASGDKAMLLAALPRSLRRVLVLVDGKRPAAKIAQILSLSLPQTEEALQELRARRLIQ